MPTVCNITFPNNPDNVFYGGQLLLGHVGLSLSNSKNVRGIYVDVTGTANCRWTEGSGRNQSTYTGKQLYLNERTYLIGGPDGNITLQPGRYNYDFQCNLPLGLPTSLEAEYGHIRYMVRIVLDRPMWHDKKYERMFTVIKPLNLNLDPNLRLPRSGEKYKTFYPCCLLCCCPSDPMHVVARIPVGGFTPGQEINVEIYVNNKSNKQTGLRVRLWKRITFHTHPNSSEKKNEMVLVCGENGIGCIGMHSSVYYRVSVFIPPIPPTDVESSRICKVQYFLEIHGPISGCNNDVKVEIPVTIGSYPILDNPNTQVSPTAPNSEGTGPIVQQPSNGSEHYPPASAPYPESDPPTYEQALKRAEDGEAFRPNYPVYRRPTLPHISMTAMSN